MSSSRIALLAAVAVASVALVGWGSGGTAQSRVAAAQPVIRAMATLHNAAGDQVGQVTFADNGGTVTVSATASGLTPGFHGFHVHGVGQCDAPDFMSAGPHFNPTAMVHAGHAGDMPSLLVNQEGAAQSSATTDRFTVSDLLAGGGTSVIVHAGPDNFANIPTRYVAEPDTMTLATGDSGGRVACGVVQSS